MSPDHLITNFPLKYHEYKAKMLKEELERVSTEKDLSREFMCLTELRMAAFHSIETLFILLLAYRHYSGNIRDDIMEGSFRIPTISVKMIENFASELTRSTASFVDDDVTARFSVDGSGLGESLKLTSLQYTLYFAAYVDKSNAHLHERITASTKLVRKQLRILAEEFLNREEYNGYKHGLRIAPGMRSMEIADPGDSSKKHQIDFGPGRSYFKKKSSKDTYAFESREYDPTRDYNICMFSSALIENLVKTRQLFLNRTTSQQTANFIVWLPEHLEGLFKKSADHHFTFEIKEN